MTAATHGVRRLGRRGFLRAAAGAAAVAGATGSAAAQQGGTTHTVDMTDELVYDPEEITIAPGDTIVWDNVGVVGHTVTAYEGEIPDGAEYFASGGFESEQAARDGFPEGNVLGGDTYEHTFEVEGHYDYFCIPHETVGMVGTVHVVAAASGGDGEGPGPEDDEGIALTPGLALLGGGLIVALLAPILFAFATMVRRARGVPAAAEAEAPAPEVSVELPEDAIVREIGHDEFTPVGTATLVLLYFVILVVLWVFMYFVEFLGGGPTITG